MEKILNLKFFKDNLFLEDKDKKLFAKYFTINNVIVKPINNLNTSNVNKKKNSIDNKIIMILNKLSENNLENLIKEFVMNIGKISYENYKILLKTFWVKIINEIDFINNYIFFLDIISYLYHKSNNFKFEYFIQIVEYSFKCSYDNITIDEFEFLKDIIINENKRKNNFILIIKLVKYKILNNNIINECQKILLKNNHIIDIYHWFNELKNQEIEFDRTIIKYLIENKNISLRETTLLEKLIL